MKTSSVFLRLCVLMVFLLAFSDAHAARHYRYARYGYRHPRRAGPPQYTNPVIVPAESRDQPVKFKDLAMNAEFYFVADKDHKLFPRMKVSETVARTVPTPASPNITTCQIPAETMVLVKKPAQGKGGDEAGAKSSKSGKKQK